MSAHSTIGPSSAKRWFNCPGSVALVATLPNPPSKYAAEGTLAHTLAEELVTGKSNTLMLYERIGDVEKVDGFDITITEEMVGAVEEYRDVIVGLLEGVKGMGKPAPIVSKSEVRLDGKKVDARLFGTADHLLYQRGNVLHVIDFKYGKGVVDADENEQLMTYAVMAMDGEAGWAFDEIFVHIFQPRARHEDGVHRTARFTAPQLQTFRERLVEAAKETAKPDAPFKSGDWCQSSFCPALKAGCPAAHKAMVAQAQVDFSVVTPTPAALPSVEVMPIEQVAAALNWKETFDAAFKGYEERIQRELEAGKQVPGYKLVPGRANRKWRDEAEVIARYEPVLGDSIFEPQTLKSPAKLEKLVKTKGEVDSFTYKPEAPLKLAKDSDPRSSEGADVRAARAASEFGALDAAVPEAMSRGVKKEADVLLARVVATREMSLEEELGLAPKAKTIWP